MNDFQQMSDEMITENMRHAILFALVNHGGETIVAGPRMDALVEEILAQMDDTPSGWAFKEHFRRALEAP